MANYIHKEKIEIEFQKRALESIPKLPTDSDLDKSLPKALRQLSVESYMLSDGHKCSKELFALIEPLLKSPNGHFLVMKDENERKTVEKTLNFLSKNKIFKMLKEYHSTINYILKNNIFWIRDISTWEWKSRNTYKQLKSLVEHLFCEYEVPEFMFQAWTNKTINHTHIEWFLHLASGKNARELYKFPIPLTKKMAHEFINTPFPGYSISDAIRRSQVIGMGGDSRLADAIMMSRLRHAFDNNDFWITVIQFFVNIPMLNLDEVGTVIDYIHEKKFVPKRIVVNNVPTYAAENPTFSMKGRNIATLIRDTHAWHRELRQLRAVRYEGPSGTSYKLDLSAKWTGSLIKPFILNEGKNEKRREWSIIEILNAEELHWEGKHMHHCVFSYLSSCTKGSCYIFSLRLSDQSVATIEMRDRRAVQIRGPYNKRPSEKELSIITQWAKKEGIEISNYAIRGL